MLIMKIKVILQIEIFRHEEKVCNFFESARSVTTGSLPNNCSHTKDQHDDHNEHNSLLIVDPCGPTRTTVKIKSSNVFKGPFVNFGI